MVNEVLQLVGNGNQDDAVRLVHSLLVGSAEPAWLIEGLLVPLQRQVGELWEASLIDAVDERAMTAIVEELLSVIAFHAPRSTDRGRLISACPRGEWHTLPARMASELLQMRAWSVTFAGASTSSGTLAALARAQRPVAVLLSCTMAAALLAAADVIELLHDHNVPVLVGGAGFGGDDRRALALGADGWARSVADADGILASWARRAPALKSASVSAPVLLSASDAADTIEVVLRRLGRRVQPKRVSDEIRVTGADLSLILDVVNVGLLTEDPTAIEEMIGWYRRAFEARWHETETIDLVVEALCETLPPRARTLLERSLIGDREFS